MKNMSCLIVDDEPLSRRLLEKYVRQIPTLELVASCPNAIEALSVLQQENIQLLFLDVNMPGLSGIKLLRSLSQPPMVIFTTAYPEYAVEGFELEAVDYLLKPFSFERFLKATNKAIQQKEFSSKAKEGQSFNESQTLLIKADKKLYQLAFDNIRYLQAYGDYVKIHTRQGQLLPKAKLSSIEQELPDDLFIRIHRSYIIALAAIQYIEGNQVCIDEQMIPIAATYREKLLAELNRK